MIKLPKSCFYDFFFVSCNGMRKLRRAALFRVRHDAKRYGPPKGRGGGSMPLCREEVNGTGLLPIAAARLDFKEKIWRDW